MPVSTVKLLEKYLDFCTEKNKVLSNNISNAGTENYKRQEISFNSFLEENFSEMKSSNIKHIAFVHQDISPSEIIYDKNTDKSSGMNNVDIEKEMSEMAANSISFKLAGRKMAEYYKNLQSAIKGDRS